jgi:hypothetical protein
MRKLLIAAALLSAASLAGASAAAAQGYYRAPYGYTYGHSYDSPGNGYYDYAPGYSGYGGDNFEYDRVDGPGRGNSAESQR